MTKQVRGPLLWGVVGAVAIGTALGLYWFQPWKLFTSRTVNDAVPTVQSTVDASLPAAPSTAPAATPPSRTAVLLAEGRLVSHEHSSSGTAQLVRLPDGAHQLILRDLATSDGPDLRVWLTDQKVLTGRDGWHVFDDGRRVELGRLKGTHGSQVYDLPANVDPAAYRSVTIWCRRFAVSFAAAPLEFGN